MATSNYVGLFASLSKSRSSTPHSEKTDDGVLDLHMRPGAGSLGRPASGLGSRLDSTLDRLKKRSVRRLAGSGLAGVGLGSQVVWYAVLWG